MKRVLFVDDEQRILDGLKRMLRAMRHEWDMHFEIDARSALETLAKERFDLVVTDMRMPEMDGAALLGEVKRLYPRMIRIVLSGHAEKTAILKTVGTAHQYLAKPCDADELKTVVNRSLALRDLLNDPQLEEIVGDTDSLPSMPSLYHELVTAAEDEKTSLSELAAIIGKDIAMSAQVLKLVNSAFFGTARAATSVERAVAYLGLDSLLSLVLSAHVFSAYETSDAPDFSLERLMDHSSLSAKLAKIIATEEGRSEMVDEAQMAGLMHEVGKLILHTSIRERYDAVLVKSREEGQSVRAAELQGLGTTHGHVGAYLLGLWGLPDSLLEAVAYHEIPSASTSEGFNALTAVHVACALVDHHHATDPEELGTHVDRDYLDKIGCLDRLPVWHRLGTEALMDGVAS